MPPDNPNPNPSSEPIYRSAGIVAQVLGEGTKTLPISAEAASGQIEAALRLHQPPTRDIFIMISGIALAAAVTFDSQNVLGRSVPSPSGTCDASTVGSFR